jgi:hypothetical protein
MSGSMLENGRILKIELVATPKKQQSFSLKFLLPGIDIINDGENSKFGLRYWKYQYLDFIDYEMVSSFNGGG